MRWSDSMLQQLELIKSVWQTVIPEQTFPKTFAVSDKAAYFELLQRVVNSQDYDYIILSDLITLAPPLLEIDIKNDSNTAGHSLLYTAVFMLLRAPEDQTLCYLAKIWYLLNAGALFTMPNDSALHLIEQSRSILKYAIYQVVMSYCTGNNFSLYQKRENFDVKLKGLQKKPALNGCIATVTGFDQSKQRYQLVIKSTGQLISVKRENIDKDPSLFRLSAKTIGISVQSIWPRLKILTDFDRNIIDNVVPVCGAAKGAPSELTIIFSALEARHNYMRDLIRWMPHIHVRQNDNFITYLTKIDMQLDNLSENIEPYYAWINENARLPADTPMKKPNPFSGYVDIFNNFMVLLEQFPESICSNQLVDWFVHRFWRILKLALIISYSFPNGIIHDLYPMLNALEAHLDYLCTDKKITTSFRHHTSYTFIKSVVYIHYHFIYSLFKETLPVTEEIYDSAYSYKMLVKYLDSEKEDSAISSLVGYTYLIKNELMGDGRIKKVISYMESIANEISRQRKIGVIVDNDFIWLAAEIRLILIYIQKKHFMHQSLADCENLYTVSKRCAKAADSFFDRTIAGRKSDPMTQIIVSMMKSGHADVLRDINKLLKRKQDQLRKEKKKKKTKPKHAAVSLQNPATVVKTIGVSPAADLAVTIKSHTHEAACTIIPAPMQLDMKGVSCKAGAAEPSDAPPRRISAKEKEIDKAAKLAEYMKRSSTDPNPKGAAAQTMSAKSSAGIHHLHCKLDHSCRFFARLKPESVDDPSLSEYVNHFLSEEARIGYYGNCIKPVSNSERTKLKLPPGTYYKIKVSDVMLPGKLLRMYGHVIKEVDTDSSDVIIEFSDRVIRGSNATHRI